MKPLGHGLYFQDIKAGETPVYGQSVTDACLSLEQTEPLLEQLARAQQARVGADRGQTAV